MNTPLPHIVVSESGFSGGDKLFPELARMLSAVGYVSEYMPTLDMRRFQELCDRAAPFLIHTYEGPDCFEQQLSDSRFRFIYLCRDLRDVAVSFARQILETCELVRQRNTVPIVLETVALQELIPAANKGGKWTALRNDRVLIQRFDEAEPDARKAIVKILAHCGVSPATNELESVHILDTEIGQYRKYFDAPLQSLFDAYLLPQQVALGYACNQSIVSGNPHESLSLFQSNRQPYYIYAPDYRQSSAGIRSLHYLCHALNELGHEAYVTPATAMSPQLRTPPLTQDIVEHHFATGRTPIALYPEVVHGNPLGLPHVARWLLNTPGHLGGDTEYPKDDLVFFYNESFLPPTMHGDMLNLPCVDFEVFNNRNNPRDKSRKGSCYFANKYLAAGGTIDPKHEREAVSLCLNIPRTAREIADILRQSEVLYCYEQSSMVLEALACGCPVLIVPTEYWHAHGGPQQIGRGVRLSTEANGLAEAQKELEGYAELVAQGLRYSWWQIQRFAEKTQALSQQRLTSEAFDSKAAQVNPWLASPSQRHRLIESFKSYASDHMPQASRKSQAPAATFSVANTGSTALALFQQRAEQWSTAPLIHLIAVHDQGDYDAVTPTLAQLSQQPYSRVILTVISNKPAPGQLEAGRLEWLTTLDSPWPVVNEALKQSPGDWCGVVRAGDQFSPLAFLSIAEFINAHPACSVLYTDEAVLEANGTLTRHQLKPDFDEDLLLSAGYVGGMLLAKKETWINAGGWRPLPRGLDEYDAAIRLTATVGTLGHLEGVHYLRHHGDPALNASGDGIDEKRLAVAQELLQIVLPQTSVELGLAPGLLHVRQPLANTPGVSIVIPTRDSVEKLDKLISSVLAETVYADYELLIVDNNSSDEKACAYLAGLAEIDPARIRVIKFSGAFNLAALLNHGATSASKELLLFLHDDVAVIHKDWLANLVTHILRPGIKAVGARLISSDGTSIVEAGISPSQAGILGRPFQGWPIDHPAPLGRVHAVQRVSAVSAACMLVAKEDFLALSGMDAERFPEKFADIDFCMKIRQAGGSIIWTPYATLIHDTDNSTWGDKSDNNALLAKWGKALVQDPRNNPYIALGSDTFVPEAEPAFMPDPITWHPLPNVYSMSSDQDGAGHYRVIQPIQNATEQGLIRGRYGLGYPVPVMMEKLDIDVVFSQRQLEDRQLDNLARFRKLLRCKIVMDFDDLLTNVPDKNVHKRTLLKDMKGRLRRVGELAHRFTVSTEPLAREFKQFHEDIRVVPNALLRSQWAHLTSQRSTSKKLRVGWAGGVSHQGDLEVIRDVVRDLSDEVEWVFMGMCLKELNPHIKEFHAGAPFNAYPAELAKLNLDLAIAPLELNAFNECKSHLRILEYGILGIPVIATNITPYQGGFPITLVKNKHQDWVKAIREHINDRDETYKRGDALRQYILDNWMLDQHLDTWRAAWEI